MWQPSWRRPTALGSLSTTDLLAEKVGPQMGSNPGGTYRGSDGVLRYVKFYKSGMQASGEVLANRLYNDLGFAAPDAVLLPYGEKFLYASTMIPSLRPYAGTKADAIEFLKGFPIDVLTMNWDVVGMDIDNIAYRPDGHVVRLDNGASFLSRARAGVRKDPKYLLAVHEYKWFIQPDPGFYDAMDRYGEIARLAGVRRGNDAPDFSATVARATALANRFGGWRAYVTANAPLFEPADSAMVVQMLDVRLAFLQSKVG